MHDRGSVVRLDQPEMMDDAEDGSDVDSPMELYPALSQSLHRAARRGHRKREQKAERCHPHHDVGSFGEIFGDLMQVETMIEEGPGREMDAGVSESGEAQRSTQGRELAPPKPAPCRCDRE